MNDLRLAFRSLVKTPGYSLLVMLTLAIGIAVNTNIYGMVHLFFLQQRPVAEPDRLVLLLQRSDIWNLPHGFSYPDYRDLRDRLQTVSGLIAYWAQPANLSAEGQNPQRVWIEVASPNSFAVLGVGATHGRTLVPSDGEAAGGGAVVVLSHRCWTQRFAQDPAIVGRVVQFNGRPFTVVGVAAADFSGFSPMLDISAFVSTGAINHLREHSADILDQRGSPAWRVMGRLSPGATVREAGAELDVAMARLRSDHPAEHRNARGLLLPENRARPDPIFADYLPVFAVVFSGLVGLVLLIACANVANLMLARAAARQQEMTIRSALGATRLCLIRQLLAESVLLSVGSGLLGWLLANWSGDVLQEFAPQGDMPVLLDQSSQWHNYLFTALISLAAGLASGWFPALRSSRIDLVTQLKEGTGWTSAGGRHRLRDMLVTSQIMFSVVVLVGAGLFLRSLQRVQSVNLGFRSDHLLLASFDLGLQGYTTERADAFHRQLLARIRALPGVVDAGLVSNVPFDYAVRGGEVWPDRAAAAVPNGHISGTFAVVSAGFQEMLGTRLQQGRAIDATDTATSRRVAVVNPTFAQVCWPGQDPIGQVFRPWKDGPAIEIVGVMGPTKTTMLAESPKPFYYVALAQDYASPVTLAVRTEREPATLAAAVAATAHDLDPHLPLYNVRTMDDLMRSSVFALLPMRMGAVMAATQGAICLLLSVLGLYAVVAFRVGQRTREIGIRMALGADPRQVSRFVVREGLRLTLWGLGSGLVLAALLGFALSRVLYGIAPVDPLVLFGITGLLVLIALLACFIPARRAMRVDPMIALRAE